MWEIGIPFDDREGVIEKVPQLPFRGSTQGREFVFDGLIDNGAHSLRPTRSQDSMPCRRRFAASIESWQSRNVQSIS